MPVARSVAAHAVALAGPGVDGGGGNGGALGPGVGTGSGTPMDIVDGADDGAEADDGRLYCWCQMGSYGDMVACDDNECEREWVSLSIWFGAAGRGRSDILSISSTWGVSDSRWHQRACGFVRRVGLSRKTGVRLRGQPLRLGGTAVRTGTLVLRHVHPPPQLDRDFPSSLLLRSLYPSCSCPTSILIPHHNLFFLASRCCNLASSSESKGTYNIVHSHGRKATTAR